MEVEPEQPDNVTDPLGLGELILFSDRVDAGSQLAGALRDERTENAVVVGLARGGVVVAAEVARALGLPLDALAVRKVGYPWQPEYAIGAVTPGDGLFLRSTEGLGDEEVEEAVSQAKAKAEVLDRRLHEARPSVAIHGTNCLLIDDGLATGATMIAAVRWAKAEGAERVVVAIPVGPPETITKLEAEVDRVICLEAPRELLAVGMWYLDFTQVSDEEVIELLKQPWMEGKDVRREVTIPADGTQLPGDLVVPSEPIGAVIFAHGSGSSRFSPRNRLVASVLNAASHATLLFDLLTPVEELDRRNVFDIGLLAERLLAATRWLREQPETKALSIGYFGASTGAAAALWAAAGLPEEIRAVVSRGGRPDLAPSQLPQVQAPTLLIVGGEDHMVLGLNREAAGHLRCEKEVSVVAGATHLFEEPGALEQAAELATNWFTRHLKSNRPAG